MSEKTDVQEPLIGYAEAIGWERVSRSDATEWRGGEKGLFFTDLLAQQLQRLNPGVVDAEAAEGVIRQLTLLEPSIKGNRDALAWMRGENSVFDPKEKRERNVRLIDFEHPDSNVFHVTEEWVQESTVFRNRADVVFLINGIPVAVAEAKAAAKPDGLAEGVDQIRRYHRETPEMFVAPQVFEVTQLLDLYYGATWSLSRKGIFTWRHGEPTDFEGKITSFFDRERFLRVLKDYIVFVTSDDEIKKMILRQHQTRAVEKVVTRAADGRKTRGLVWHTQGSGKTLTMITVASLILRDTRDDKPTVLMIVDRNELEAQLFRNLESCGIGSVRVARSKKDLREILASDYRGLAVSMLHKFDDIPADINTRANITVLIDEAHRTMGGPTLGVYLMAALPNATFVGFTGTPIDRISKGKGTFKVFGCEDERGYLDKYSIAESIEDGTTVRLHYAHGPSNLRVDRDLLEREFLKLADAEGVSDVEELNAILDRAVELKEMMKAPQRVDRVAKLVAEHFTENVEPMGFKAFLVGVDREACALYKEALDRYLPPDCSVAVYSGSPKDSALLKRHQIGSEDEKQVRKAFTRRGDQPKILIVTEKLLTGYDAPILYCMYLDKPMRDHVLLQTIARVNRPYEEDDGLVKPCGLVFDFVGIFEKLEDALAFDSDVVTSVIENIDVLKQLFERTMTTDAPQYLGLARLRGDKGREAQIGAFEDEEARKEFYDFYRRLQAVFDILTPDPMLRPYLEDYLALSEMYAVVRGGYEPSVYADR